MFEFSPTRMIYRIKNRMTNLMRYATAFPLVMPNVNALWLSKVASGIGVALEFIEIVLTEYSSDGRSFKRR